MSAGIANFCTGHPDVVEIKYKQKKKSAFKHNVFIPLVVTSFSHFDHPQVNATQNLRRLVTCGVHKFQVV